MSFSRLPKTTPRELLGDFRQLGVREVEQIGVLGLLLGVSRLLTLTVGLLVLAVVRVELLKQELLGGFFSLGLSKPANKLVQLFSLEVLLWTVLANGGLVEPLDLFHEVLDGVGLHRLEDSVDGADILWTFEWCLILNYGRVD